MKLNVYLMLRNLGAGGGGRGEGEGGRKGGTCTYNIIILCMEGGRKEGGRERGEEARERGRG